MNYQVSALIDLCRMGMDSGITSFKRSMREPAQKLLGPYEKNFKIERQILLVLACLNASTIISILAFHPRWIDFIVFSISWPMMMWSAYNMKNVANADDLSVLRELANETDTMEAKYED